MTPLAAELQSHLLFRSLNKREITFLAESAELLRGSPGGTLIRAGDRVEALYLLRQGETLTGEGRRRNLPGDFFFASALSGPVAPSETWSADTEVSVLRISGSRFRYFLEQFPGAVNRLKPRKDHEGRQVSGLPDSAWRPLRELVRRKRSKKIGPVIHWSGRQSLIITGIRMFLPGSAALVLFSLSRIAAQGTSPADQGIPLYRIYAAGGILMAAIALLILVKRFFSTFRILEDGLEIKRFGLREWSGTVSRIPFDRIQGSEVRINGLFRKAFAIGTVRINTSAEGATAEFRDISHPLAVRDRILALAAERTRESRDLERSDIRQAVEEHYGLRQGFTLVSGKSDKELGLPEKAPVHEPVTFRKSSFVLFRALLSPLFFLLAAGGGLSALYLTGRLNPPFLAVFPGAVMLGALGVALWRWLDWRNDLFRIEGGTVIDIDRKPFGKSESRKQIALASAQNIASEQKGFLAWLFDFGNVTVITPGGVSDICFESVSHPAEVQRTLFRARELWLKSQDRIEENRRVREILEVTDEIRRAGELRQSEAGAGDGPEPEN